MRIVLLCVALLFGACEKETKPLDRSSQKSAAQKPQPQKQQKKSEFILKDMNGTEIKLRLDGDTLRADRDEPLTLLFFYTDWCPSCKAQTPELERLYQRFSNDLFVIGLPLEPSRKNTSYFVSASIDENNELAKALYTKVQAGANMPIPLLVLLKDGRYYRHYVGAVPYEILESDIKSAKGE